jgi:hypothetical protein
MNDRHLEYEKEIQKINSLIYLAEKSEGQVQGHLACYACVRISGLIESAVRELLLAYAESAASPKVANYVTTSLRGFQNPKLKKILEVFAQFDSAWASSLSEFTSSKVKDAIDSIVSNRHQIAHGKNVNLSLGVLKEYYKSVLSFIKQVELTIA